MQTTRLQQMMQLLGDETRYRMFEVLLENRNLCVSEISHLLGVSSSAISQHFRMLELAGLVTKQRNGQRMCYQAVKHDPIVSSLAQLITTNQQLEVHS